MADIYRPHTSGVTSYIALNKQFLERKGHQVFVFTFGNLDYQDGENNVIRSPGLPVLAKRYFLNFAYPRKTVGLLQTMDVLHVHHPFISGQLAIRYSKKNKIPIVFTNHTRYDLYMQAYFPVIPGRLGDTFLQDYMPSFCSSIDLVISPSRGMRDVLVSMGVDEHCISVIPNGIELSNFRNGKQSRSRVEFGYSGDDVVLIYMGRIAPEKNLQLLVRSFEGLVKSINNAKLLIIGDGPELGTIRRMVRNLGLQDKISFTGLVEYDELINYLALGDAFVTASTSEVHPLSVIEAMASGLPILGINSAGMNDIVIDEVNGLLSANDQPTFTSKMARLVTENKLRKQMAQQAKFAAELFSIEKTAALVLNQYERLVSSSRARSGRMDSYSQISKEKGYGEL